MPDLPEAGDGLAFVLAPPYSGAQALLGALASIPDVCVLNGSGVFGHGIARIFRNYKPPTGVGLVRLIDEEQLVDQARALTDAVFQSYRAQRSCGHLVEYSASNIMFAHQIAAIYPGARLIHLVRDARQAVMAGKVSGRAPGTLSRDARTWSRAHRAILYGTPLTNMIRLHLEAMADDPEGALSRLLEHLGLEADEAERGETVARLRAGIAAGTSSQPSISWMSDRIVRAEAEAELALLGYITSPGRPGLASRAAARGLDEAWLRLRRPRSRGDW